MTANSTTSKGTSEVKYTNFIVDNYVRTVLVDGNIGIVKRREVGSLGLLISFYQKISTNSDVEFSIDSEWVYCDSKSLYFVEGNVLSRIDNLTDCIRTVMYLPTIYSNYKVCLQYDEYDKHFVLACTNQRGKPTFIDISYTTKQIVDYSDTISEIENNMNLNYYSESNSFYRYKSRTFLSTLNGKYQMTTALGRTEWSLRSRIQNIESGSYFLSEYNILNNQSNDLWNSPKSMLFSSKKCLFEQAVNEEGGRSLSMISHKCKIIGADDLPEINKQVLVYETDDDFKLTKLLLVVTKPIRVNNKLRTEVYITHIGFE